ncbi:MAG: tetratricopeptide repeat protein [Candidatus Polarisedimenticolia bacterium]
MKRATRLLLAAAGTLALAAIQASPIFADAIVRVKGRVVDMTGKPMPKVSIWFEGVDIKKKVGPVRTNKDGNYIIATLDRSVAKKWHVYPELPGYKVVKIAFEIVDSERKERAKNDGYIVGTKQEFPVLEFAPVGDVGRNIVDFFVAKDAEYAAAVQAERSKREGGTAATPGAAATGTATPVPAAPAAVAGGKDLLERAQGLVAAGKHAEAVEVFRQFVAKDPKGNPPVYYHLGKSLFLAGDDQAAEKAFLEGLALKPDMRGVHFYLGNLHLKRSEDPVEEQAEAARAAEEFGKELELTPDNDTVHYHLGLALLKAGRDDQALAAFEQAVLLNPQRSEAYLKMAAGYEKRKDTAKAEEMYQKFSAADPSRAAESLYNIGVIAWNENRTKDAVQYFGRAAQLDPQYALAHRELGYALMRQQDFKGALKHFQEYLRLNPKASDAKQIEESIALLR